MAAFSADGGGGVRQRKTELANDVKDGARSEGVKFETEEPHPAGPVKHGSYTQKIRMTLFGLYVASCVLCIHLGQFLGATLYFYDKNWFYAWMAVMKQHFGLFIITLTQWWSPTVVRISGDKSVKGQLRRTRDGRLESDFPERIVLVANHQIYTDWLYLWWAAYTARMHGHLYIILKESLQYIPFIGPGMKFFSFIFLSRNWVTDKPRFQHRLSKLKAKHKGPMAGSEGLDPMWLLIFPEGTNLSDNGREKSAAWAKKSGTTDLRHALLPRSTGLLFCLQELKDTVDWVYDCTVAYEGVPRGRYGQDLYTINSTYFQGRPPKSVNLHWRRFAVADIPLDNEKDFARWVDLRWREKDDLLEHYVSNGQFPADEEAVVDEGTETHMNGSASKTEKIGRRTNGHIETEVCQSNPLEFLQIYAPTAALGLIVNIVLRVWWMLTEPFRRA